MNKRVLVIDNDAACREVLHEALQYYGFDVKTEDGHQDIIGSVDGFEPDVLLIDFLLDGINGGEWCSQIKKDATRSSLPVIIISAHSRILNSLGHYGCDAFIAKPFDLDNLVDTVTELACKRRN